MQPSEAAQVLTKIAMFDRRTFGEAEAHAWAEVLDGKVSLPDALAAVTLHFGQSAAWLMPLHLVEIVKELRRKRIAGAGYADIPNGLTQQQERQWLRAWRDMVGDGLSAWESDLLADQLLQLPPREPSSADPERIKKLIEDFAATRELR